MIRERRAPLWAVGAVVLLSMGCGAKAVVKPPLGMVLARDGVTYAGAAVVDITPDVTETYTDLNGNNLFDGCLDQPSGDSTECPEPFDDANGNGWFDAVWIGGFSPLRPAQSVNDPITVRALVVAQDGEYVAFVALDLVGLGSPRIHAARDALAADGFDPDRLIVASTHNHQGPDSMGLWGNPYDFGNPVSGIRPAYQERISAAIEQAVRQAAGTMEAVRLKVGSTRMRDRSVFFNGSDFGGKNPRRRMHGMINDGRDPVIVSDQLLVLQGLREDDSAVFTFTLWSGHPEVWGGDNTAISSDWPGVTREILETAYGGVAIHMPECLGGMQSALGGDLPLVMPDGVHVYDSCDATQTADASDLGCFGRTAGEPRLDGDGDAVPLWAPHGTREFVVSHGWHIAEAAMAALSGAEVYSAAPLRVEAETFYVPVHNIAYRLLGPMGLFDLNLDDAVTDPALCFEARSSGADGCIPTRTFRVRLGPVGLITAPGEILPELAWGLPSGDPRWAAEATDPAARGPGGVYFRQHPVDCNALGSWEECRNGPTVGSCDCLRAHTWPYRLSEDPSVPPLLDLLDAPFKAAMSMVDNYMSYIIPEPDVHYQVSLLSDDDGDHYEDTVTISWRFATYWQEAQLRIADRW